MKKTTATFLALMIAVLAFGCRQQKSWATYTSAQGRYSVLFPGSPDLSTQEATTATGSKITQYLANATDSGAVYSVIYFDKGGMTFSFDGARNGAVAAVKGTLQAEKPISLGDYPGRELKISAKGSDGGEYVSVARYYEAEGRIYVVQFVCSQSSQGPASDQAAAKFFDSFQVSKAR